jgi:hypothetical protein
MRTALLLALVLSACSGGGRRSTTTTTTTSTSTSTSTTSTSTSTSTTSSSASSASAADMLVALSSVETMHHGMGSSSTRMRIDAKGGVWNQRGASMVRCRALDAAQLEALRAAIRRAMASGLREVYNTSAHPGPNANYSRTTTLELNLDGKDHSLRIEGWADVPRQVSAVMNRVNQASAGCATK